MATTLSAVERAERHAERIINRRYWSRCVLCKHLGAMPDDTWPEYRDLLDAVRDPGSVVSQRAAAEILTADGFPTSAGNIHAHLSSEHPDDALRD